MPRYLLMDGNRNIVRDFNADSDPEAMKSAEEIMDEMKQKGEPVDYKMCNGKLLREIKLYI